MNEQKNNKRTVFVVDDNFRIVYSNFELKSVAQEFSDGRHCYEVLCKEKSQCKKCPIRPENNGSSMLFHSLTKEWVRVNASPVEWPGVGSCHMVMTESMGGSSKDSFYNAVGHSDYNELLELEYKEDTYSVIYHADQSEHHGKLDGQISTMIKEIAESRIHPEDRERFYQFWLLDHVGDETIPKELLTTRHGEFRKLMADGSYGWVRQVLMPARQSSDSDIFVMSFYNEISDDVQTRKYDASNGELVGSELCNMQDFFKNVRKILKNASDDSRWCMIAIDIEKFNLFNEWYGRKTGNELLASISECLEELEAEESIAAGYFGNDDFGLMMPYDEDRIEALYQTVSSLIKSHSDKMNVLPAIGTYEITERDERIFTMYDRAKLACTAVKGNYAVRSKKFDREMLEKIESEYLLFSDIQKALKNKEFLFYLQPKCNMATGKIVGAEALVRWNSPEKGMVSPGVFIPFLEKSGFIAELDTYIWEEVCKWQKQMMDLGKKTVPISVNLSRVDMYSVDVPAFFAELIEKYQLDPNLIEAEITEGVYVEDEKLVNQVAAGLRNLGICVLMDDFGSAYSSLNMLKDIDVDVLKIDMRFLGLNEINSTKGIGIIETVCNMAHIMGINIIAEGIETKEQRDFLVKMGCGYGQGYYFYRPLPTNQFEQLISDDTNIDFEGFRDVKFEQFLLKDVLSKDVFSEIMLNNMLGAVAFYEVIDENITVLKNNDSYANLIGGAARGKSKVQLKDFLEEDDYRKLLDIFSKAKENRNEGAEGEIRRKKSNGSDMWLQMRIFFLREHDGRAVYYSALNDVTEIHIKNKMLTEQNEALQFLNNDMPGGYYRHANNDTLDILYLSKRFLEILGFTRSEIKDQFDDKFINMVHPDDREFVLQGSNYLKTTGGNYSQPYRMRSKSGYINIADQARLVNYGGEEFFQGIIFTDTDYYQVLDVDEESDVFMFEYNALDSMPCGFFQSEVDGEHRFGYVSTSMLDILGYSPEAFDKKFGNTTEKLVWPEDRAKVDEEVKKQIKARTFVCCEYRIELADGSLKWVYSVARMRTDANGKRWFCACIVDYDYLKAKYREQEWQQLKYKTLAEIPGALVYDYNPELDRLTVELSTENGEKRRIDAENFLEEMENQDFIDENSVEEQRTVITNALKKPVSGTTEFKGQFFKDKGFQWYRFHYTSIADENGKVYRIVGRADNIEKEIQTISDWKQRAMEDSLTGLLNNDISKKKLAQEIEKQKGGINYLVDVDNFKAINDTLGHVQGDNLLKHIAEIIRDTFTDGDIMARVGGDEFFICMPGVFDRELAEEKAEQILKKMDDISLPEGTKAHCSIGISISNDKNLSAEMLLDQTDIALYKAKRGGKNRYAFFDDGK